MKGQGKWRGKGMVRGPIGAIGLMGPMGLMGLIVTVCHVTAGGHCMLRYSVGSERGRITSVIKPVDSSRRMVRNVTSNSHQRCPCAAARGWA